MADASAMGSLEEVSVIKNAGGPMSDRSSEPLVRSKAMARINTSIEGHIVSGSSPRAAPPEGGRWFFASWICQNSTHAVPRRNPGCRAFDPGEGLAC